jgi:hypothetical protein
MHLETQTPTYIDCSDAKAHTAYSPAATMQEWAFAYPCINHPVLWTSASGGYNTQAVGFTRLSVCGQPVRARPPSNLQKNYSQDGPLNGGGGEGGGPWQHSPAAVICCHQIQPCIQASGCVGPHVTQSAVRQEPPPCCRPCSRADHHDDLWGPRGPTASRQRPQGISLCICAQHRDGAAQVLLQLQPDVRGAAIARLRQLHAHM